MLFAAYDYLNFRRRSGRYARNIPDRISFLSWSQAIPEGVWRSFHPGTVIGTADFGSFASWAIMYGTSGFASHVATYVNAGHIVHLMPKTGVVFEPIDVLFGKKVRLYPII